MYDLNDKIWQNLQTSMGQEGNSITNSLSNAMQGCRESLENLYDYACFQNKITRASILAVPHLLRILKSKIDIIWPVYILGNIEVAIHMFEQDLSSVTEDEWNEYKSTLKEVKKEITHLLLEDNSQETEEHLMTAFIALTNRHKMALFMYNNFGESSIYCPNCGAPVYE